MEYNVIISHTSLLRAKGQGNNHIIELYNTYFNIDIDCEGI